MLLLLRAPPASASTLAVAGGSTVCGIASGNGTVFCVDFALATKASSSSYSSPVAPSLFFLRISGGTGYLCGPPGPGAALRRVNGGAALFSDHVAASMLYLLRSHVSSQTNLRSAIMEEEKRAHAMLFPFPCSGHINPTLKLDELLHSRGVHVTFVNTDHNHDRLRRPRGRDGFRFESVPDGMSDADRDALDKTVRLYLSLRNTCTAPLVDLARRVGALDGVPPVTCVVLSGLVSFALGVAEELRVPSFVLWGTSALGFVCTLRLRQLRHRGYTPLKDASCLTNGYLDTPIDWIEGMLTVRLGDVSTTENIWAGVPMICAPGFADQYINSRYACGEWGIGLRLDEELMGGGERGEEMRRSAAEWKARAEAVTAPGGSAYENLDKLVKELCVDEPDADKLAAVTHGR